MAFTKVHQSILQSSLWCEDSDTKVVWITLLALADRHGEIAGSIPGIARTAGVPLAKCQSAIEKFMSPDPFSRTPDNEGRRLEAIDGGWALINYAKYRHEASKEDSKEKGAKRQQRHRDKALRGVTRNGESVTLGVDVTLLHDKVTHSNAPSRSVTENRDIAEAEAEAEAEADNHDHETSKPTKQNPKLEEAYRILDVLNEVSGMKFRRVESSLSLILARLNEDGVDLEGCLTMIRRQAEKWKGTEYFEYLRPSTLFAKSKFDAYYAAKDMPTAKPKAQDEIPIWQQIKTLEALVADHPGNWESLRFNRETATPELKADFEAQKQKLRELRKANAS